MSDEMEAIMDGLIAAKSYMNGLAYRDIGKHNAVMKRVDLAISVCKTQSPNKSLEEK